MKTTKAQREAMAARWTVPSDGVKDLVADADLAEQAIAALGDIIMGRVDHKSAMGTLPEPLKSAVQQHMDQGVLGTKP